MNHPSSPHRHRITSAAAACATLAAATLATAFAVGLTACGGAGAESTASPSDSATLSTPEAIAKPAAPAHAEPPALWSADGRSRTTPVAQRPADSAAHWPGQRYATQAQLERELLIALPFTMVIDADDEGAVESAMALGETLQTFGSDKTLLALFVRSRHPALAARLAERLTREQGWANVWVLV